MLWINANVNDRSEKESEMNRSQCEAPVHLYRGGRVMILLCFCLRWAITMWRNAPKDLSVVSTIEDSLSSGSTSLLPSLCLSPSMCLQVWSFLTWHLEWVAVVSQGWEVEVKGQCLGGYGRNFCLILTPKINGHIKDFSPSLDTCSLLVIKYLNSHTTLLLLSMWPASQSEQWAQFVSLVVFILAPFHNLMHLIEFLSDFFLKQPTYILCMWYM